MFCVMYEFTVDPNRENEFKNLWHELTLKIKDYKNSRGSRLHKVTEVEHTWVAYAQWLSEEDYEKSPTDLSFDRLREKFLATCKEIKILGHMEVVDDLLS